MGSKALHLSDFFEAASFQELNRHTERISCAIMSKSRGQWVFAGIVTVVAIAEVTVFLLKLFGVM